ncbi:MAG: type II toxin-antitoxin system VapC family toxin [Promethearchaeota archaeon]
MEGIFIDTDILFRIYAISDEKIELWRTERKTGIEELDFALRINDLIKEEDLIPCISDISITELIGVLKSNHSPKSKIQRVIRLIFENFKILDINDLITKMSWVFSANYEIHSGDSLHLSTLLFYEIDKFAIYDKKFSTSVLTFQDEITNNKIEVEELFYVFPNFSISLIPEKIIKSINHIYNLKILTPEVI